MPILTSIALAAAPAVAAPDPILARMVALYDEVCLQTFPIDAAVDAAMTRKGARPLTPEQAKVTLKDDPGRGWLLADGDQMIQVMIEMPPYHACSVRRTIPRKFADLSAYRTLADAFEANHRTFAPIKPYEVDIGDIHIHAVGEQRDLPGGGGESLLVFDQYTAAPAKAAKEQPALDFRFVHQIFYPGAQ